MAKPVLPLARRVRQLREAADMSQQALAAAAGVSISVVTQLEQGTKADPRISTVAALARALGVGVDALVSEPVADERPSGGPPPAQARPKGRKRGG
jgi:transcriptional regulator with XRE-family HTH domain